MNSRNFTLIFVGFAFKFADSFLDSVDVIATKSGLVNKMLLHTMFPLKDLIAPSLELALTSCQDSFKWDQWNCPSTDFLSKRTSKYLDRESAYVSALTTAALIYTMTKNCSAGSIPGCGCREDKGNPFAACSDDPEYAEEVVATILNSRHSDSLDVQAYAVLHNDRAAKFAIRKSLKLYCHCEDDLMSCSEGKCWHSLRPFVDVASVIRQMYERALIVSADNSGSVNWQHIPEDVLVYVQDSPNYCHVDAIPGWTGMRGRQCSREKGKSVSFQERHSCRNLCRSCGLRTRGQTVVGQKRCNCRFSWCCEVKCDVCVTVEKQYYCD